MLSQHEISTPILVKDSLNPLDLDLADLDSLVGRELVTLEKRPSGRAWPASPIAAKAFWRLWNGATVLPMLTRPTISCRAKPH